jgi:lambda family phage tail tape measure protein
MTDVIGQSTIKVVADATDLKAGMADARKAVEGYEKAAASSAKNAASSIAGSMQQAERAVESYSAQQRRFISQVQTASLRVGRPTSAYLEERAALLGVSKETSAYIARVKESEKVTLNYGNSIKQNVAAMRLLPAQITDIVTSLVSGQPAYLVAIQQGGQLKDSFGGIGPAARALLSVFTPMRIALLAAGTAAGAMVAFFTQAVNESNNLQRALILSGNAAGTNADQISAMARSIAEVVGSQRDAMAALTALVEGGRLASSAFASVGEAMVNLERNGVAFKESSKIFNELYREPLRASEKLNESIHYLTLAQAEQIRVLQEQNRHQEAGTLAVELYARAVNSRMPQVEASLNIVTRTWRGMKDAINEDIDAVRNFFRAVTDTQGLEALKKARGDRELGSGYSANQPLLAMAQKRNDEAERALQLQIDQASRATKAAGDEARNTEAAIKANAEIIKLRDQSLSKQEQLNRALKEYRTNLENIRKADPESPRLNTKEISQIEANLREKFKDPAKGRVNEGERYLDSLQKQFIALTGVTAEEEAALAIERLRTEENVKISAKLEERILKQAQSIDAFKDEKAMLELIAGAMQRNADLVKLEAAQWANAQAAAKEYLDTLRRGFGRELDARASTRNDQERAAGLNQIEDRYAQQLLQLRALEELNPGKDYTEELNLLRSSRAEALRIYDQYYARRRQQDLDGALGIQVATKQYIEDAKNNFELFGRAATGVFQGLEDVFYRFATTGKASIKDFASVVVAELSRISAKKIVLSIVTDSSGAQSGWLDALMKAAGAYFGASSGTGFGTGSNFGNQDYGAYLAKGTEYVPYDNYRAVLHKGEAVVPAAENPAAGGKGWGGTTVNINVNGVKDEGGLRRSASQVAAAAGRAVAMGSRNR